MPLCPSRLLSPQRGDNNSKLFSVISEYHKFINIKKIFPHLKKQHFLSKTAFTAFWYFAVIVKVVNIIKKVNKFFLLLALKFFD